MPINPLFKEQVKIVNGNKVKIKPYYAKWLYPHNQQRTYEKDLVNLNSKLINIVKSYVSATLPLLVIESKLIRGDDKNLRLDEVLSDNIKNMSSNIEKSFEPILSDDNINNITRENAFNISEYNHGQLNKVINSATNVIPVIYQPYLTTEIELFQLQNSNLINDIASQHVKNTKGTIIRNLALGYGVKVILDKLNEDFEKSKRRSRRIARDQTAKLNANLTRLRQKELGIDYYSWLGVLDERERQTHLNNEKKIFSWDKAPAKTGHPGSQPYCRCIAQPYLTDEMFND